VSCNALRSGMAIAARVRAACLLLSCGLGGDVSVPSLLLITLDTTRADHLGSHAYPHGSTPNLDRLAAEGSAG
jgi:hypothetical protein